MWLLFFAFRSLKVFDFILFRVMTVGGNMATLKNVYRHTHGAKLLSRCLVFVCFFILQTIYHLNPTNSVHRDVSTTTSKIETKTLISDVVIVLNSSVTVIINYKQLGKKARLSNWLISKDLFNCVYMWNVSVYMYREVHRLKFLIRFLPIFFPNFFMMAFKNKYSANYIYIYLYMYVCMNICVYVHICTNTVYVYICV